MEETFVCFEMDAALFLLSLPDIVHIYPGRKLNEGRLPEEWGGSSFFDIAALFGDTPPDGREYTILICRSEESRGVLADSVKGVFPVSDVDRRRIPEALLGDRNRFLKDTVYIEELERWAFIADVDLLFDMTDEMEDMRNGGEEGETQSFSGECR